MSTKANTSATSNPTNAGVTGPGLGSNRFTRP